MILPEVSLFTGRINRLAILSERVPNDSILEAIQFLPSSCSFLPSEKLSIKDDSTLQIVARLHCYPGHLSKTTEQYPVLILPS